MNEKFFRTFSFFVSTGVICLIGGMLFLNKGPFAHGREGYGFLNVILISGMTLISSTVVTAFGRRTPRLQSIVWRSLALLCVGAVFTGTIIAPFAYPHEVEKTVIWSDYLAVMVATISSFCAIYAYVLAWRYAFCTTEHIERG